MFWTGGSTHNIRTQSRNSSDTLAILLNILAPRQSSPEASSEHTGSRESAAGSAGETAVEERNIGALGESGGGVGGGVGAAAEVIDEVDFA